MVFASKKMEEMEDMVNQNLNSIRGLVEQRFEDMNQRIKKIELAVEKLLASTESNVENNIHDSRERCLRLQFDRNISLPIMTGEQIKGEGGNPMQLSLVDGYNGTVVNFGPEASAEVEIVALEGDLNEEILDIWTAEEFNSKIAGEGNKSILAGNVKLRLDKGIVSLSGVKFRSSQHHSSGVFKIGARMVDIFYGIRVIEAKIKSFQVHDYRRKYNQKHYPPSASDEVWRLANIGKGGPIYERLKREKVNYVEDFQSQLSKDPEGLKCLVGMPGKKWEATVSHALTCTYHNQENRVVNVVGQVPGQTLECEHADASNMSLASADVDKGVVSFGDEGSLLQCISHSSAALELSNSSRLENTGGQDIEDSEMGEFDPTNLNTSFENTLSSINPTSFIWVESSNVHSTNDVEIMNRSHSSLQGLGPHLPSDSPLQIPDIDLYKLIDWQDEFHGEELCIGSHAGSVSKRRKIWTLLFTVSKWFSRRKRIAAFEGNHDQKKQRVC